MSITAKSIAQLERRQRTSGTSTGGPGAAGAGEQVGSSSLDDPAAPAEEAPSTTLILADAATAAISQPSLAAEAPQLPTSSSSFINPKLASGTPALVGSAGDASSAGIGTGESQGSSNGGAIAGAAVGCLLGGLIIGALLAFLFLRRRSRKLASANSAHDADGDASEKGSPNTHTVALPYASKNATSNKSDAKALAASRARILALEKERNAASAFGDTLDGTSESELVAQLSGVNERVAQIAMALSVQQVDGARVGSGPAPRALSETAVAALQRRGVPLESAVRHTINNILHARLCTPFCFTADSRKSHSAEGLLRTVSRDFEQAQAGRWRVMSHSALRQASPDTTGKTTLSIVSNELNEALAELCVWAGLDAQLVAARQRVRGCTNGRIEEATEALGKLIFKLKEEMSTAEFSVVQAEPSTLLSGSLGLSARLARGGSKRVLLAADQASSS